jgi:hypothetical protein
VVEDVGEGMGEVKSPHGSGFVRRIYRKGFLVYPGRKLLYFFF